MDGNSDGKDRVRVVRVLEYVGPRDVVQRTLDKSIQGRLDVPGDMTITAVQLREVVEHGLAAHAVDEVLAEARQHPDTRRPARAELLAGPYHAPRQWACPDCTVDHMIVAHPWGEPCPVTGRQFQPVRV